MFSNVEERAVLKHSAWLLKLAREGVASRLAWWSTPEKPDELVKPWGQLSARAQEYNIDDIRDGDALIELTDSRRVETS